MIHERSQAATDQRIEDGRAEIVGKLGTVPAQEPDKVRPIRLRDAGEQARMRWAKHSAPTKAGPTRRPQARPPAPKAIR